MNSMATSEVSRPRGTLVFVVLLPAVLTYALLQSVVAPVLPLLVPALDTDRSTVTWLMTGYLLAAAVATPILGRLGDRVGKKRVLVATLGALTLGSLLAATTGSVTVMIAARVLQGVGGGVLPLTFGIIRDRMPPHRVGGAVGVASALASVGGGLGLVLAGPIVDALDHHWLFWFPMIMTALAGVAVLLYVPESPKGPAGPVDVRAALLLSAWLVSLLLAVTKGAAWGWASVPTLGLFGAAALAMAGWVAVELSSGSPLIDMRTMRVRAVWTTNIVAFVAGVGMFATMTFLPQLLQTPRDIAGFGLDADITGSGLYMVPVTVAMFLLSLAAAPLGARIGPKYVVLVGSVIMVLPFVGLALAHDRSPQIYLASGVLGIGLGLVFSAMSAIIVSAVPATQTGAVTGMNANIRTIGGAIGTAVAGSILTAGPDVAQGFPSEAGYTRVFWFLAVVSLPATVASLLIPTSSAPASDDIDGRSEDLPHEGGSREPHATTTPIG